MGDHSTLTFANLGVKVERMYKILLSTWPIQTSFTVERRGSGCSSRVVIVTVPRNFSLPLRDQEMFPQLLGIQSLSPPPASGSGVYVWHWYNRMEISRDICTWQLTSWFSFTLFCPAWLSSLLSLGLVGFILIALKNVRSSISSSTIATCKVIIFCHLYLP